MSYEDNSTAVDRQDILAALEAAAQAKGSPLNNAELVAVYAGVGSVERPTPAEAGVTAETERERLSAALSVKY